MTRICEVGQHFFKALCQHNALKVVLIVHAPAVNPLFSWSPLRLFFYPLPLAAGKCTHGIAARPTAFLRFQLQEPLRIIHGSKAQVVETIQGHTSPLHCRYCPSHGAGRRPCFYCSDVQICNVYASRCCSCTPILQHVCFATDTVPGHVPHSCFTSSAV